MKFKLKQYIYFVKDMIKMRHFYVNILGLGVIKNKFYTEDKWLELGGKGFKLCLHKSPTAGSMGKNRNKLVFAVDDVGKSRDFLVRNNIKMGRHHFCEELEGYNRNDPEGNKFQIACSRKSDEKK